MAEGQLVALVALKDRKWSVVLSHNGQERKKEVKAGNVIGFLTDSTNNQPSTILSIMGGPGQALFTRLSRTNVPIFRIPRYRLQELSGIVPKAPTEQVVQALLRVWKENRNAFYQIRPLDKVVTLLRQLTRLRLGIQDFRKRAQLQFYGALRELRYILPSEAGAILDLIEEGAKEMFKSPELRKQIEEGLARLEPTLPEPERKQALAVTKHFANPRFILGAKQDEEELEKQISHIVTGLPIWDWLHPANGSVLPAVKGLGPALGGAIVSEIGDIRQFPARECLRAYARFHVTTKGEFPQRKSGDVSPWNMYLNRAVWLWSTDQVPRYDHPWRKLYYWKKAKELQAHLEVVPKGIIDRQQRKRVIYLFTLKHLDSRAKRWVGSQFLNYLWDLWTVVEKGDNPEVWYAGSSWPAYFSRIEQELNAGLMKYLEEEIPKRRRTQPKEEEEGEEES